MTDLIGFSPILLLLSLSLSLSLSCKCETLSSNLSITKKVPTIQSLGLSGDQFHSELSQGSILDHIISIYLGVIEKDTLRKQKTFIAFRQFQRIKELCDRNQGPRPNVCFLFPSFVVLMNQTRALHVLGKYSTTELHVHPIFFLTPQLSLCVCVCVCVCVRLEFELRLHPCKTGALPLEPHLQSILIGLFWRWGVSGTISLD
jgi:hypothetical protein